MVKRHTSTGALLFLGAIAAGTLLLCTGLTGDAPERKGVRLPQRNTAAFTTHARMGIGRGSPGHRGEPVIVKEEPLTEKLQDFLSTAETKANRALDRDHLFIQLYGGIQRLSDRTVIEDVDPRYSVVKLADGSLTFINAEPRDVTGHGRSVARLAEVLEDRDIPLLYVQAPQKLRPGDERLPEGVTDYGDDYADQILDLLREQGVSTLDLRKTFASSGRDWSSFFYRTDHHWTPEGAFVAHQALAEVLKRDYGFDIPDRNTDPDAFVRKTFPDWFLGSQGKRVGGLYGGVDDVELWRPRFYTDFTYSVPIYDMERKGPFETSLLFPERLEEKDYFGVNPYTLYAGGDYPLARIYNHWTGEEKRILLLRDSYACALTPFLALDCAELITVDLRYFHDDLMTYVDWLKPDLVLVLYTAGSTALDELFDFFPEKTPFFADDYKNAPPIAAKPPLPSNS